MKAIYKVGVLVEGNEFIEEFIFERYTLAQTKFRVVLRDAMMNGPSVGLVVMREYLLKGERYECAGDVKSVDLEDFDRDAMALERSNKVLRSILSDIAAVAGIDGFAAPETYAERIAAMLATSASREVRSKVRRISSIEFEVNAGEYNFCLTGYENEFETIKALHQFLGTGLKDTKEFVKGASPDKPAKVTGLSLCQAGSLLNALEGPAGGKAYINNPKLLPASDEAAGINPEG